MLKQIMMCDMCGEEIPTYEKEVLRGIRKSKYMPHLEDTLHIHFCEKCTAQIDINILEWKLSVMENCK